MDHPRTRGVYGGCNDTVVTTGGSSPHARGLQYGLNVAVGWNRIIPARAGFTNRRIWSQQLGRIIPARAGFTEEGHPVTGNF